MTNKRYAHFLLHVYFNQDTLRPEVLNVQSNKGKLFVFIFFCVANAFSQEMWTFINQFSFQLEEYVYSQTNSSTNRKKFNGFVKFSLLPSLCILDIFYSKVFTLDKANNQQALVSNKLLDDLLQLCQLEGVNLSIASSEVC